MEYTRYLWSSNLCVDAEMVLCTVYIAAEDVTPVFERLDLTSRETVMVVIFVVVFVVARSGSLSCVHVHVVAGRTCSPGIVHPLSDPEPLVQRQGPWLLRQHQETLGDVSQLAGTSITQHEASKVSRWRPDPCSVLCVFTKKHP